MDGLTDSRDRKRTPIATGVLDFFPDAIAEVARVSLAATEQHHPGEPMHWDKSKSTDEADALVRHLLERGKRDTDGQRHSAKVAWRGLALLQRELEAEKAAEGEELRETGYSEVEEAGHEVLKSSITLRWEDYADSDDVTTHHLGEVLG